MALTGRQQLLYTHLCNLYSVTRNPNSDGIGTPGPETITLAYSNVPCFYEYTENMDAPTNIGRIKIANLLTKDTIHFAISQEVQDGWWALNISPPVNGIDNPNNGQVHRLLGAPRDLPGTPTRTTRVREINAQVAEQSPTLPES